MQYQSAVVHVPTHVRAVASRLRRAEHQLQLQQRVHGQQPELSVVAAAAGVTLKHAEQALAATGGALQVWGLDKCMAVCEASSDIGRTIAGFMGRVSYMRSTFTAIRMASPTQGTVTA